MDALPHFGYEGRGGIPEALKHRLTYFVIALDVIAWIVLIFLLEGQPLIVIPAALVAISPDLAWPYIYFRFERKGKKPLALGRLSKLHSFLNWYERPWGIITEVAWFIGAVAILASVR